MQYAVLSGHRKSVAAVADQGTVRGVVSLGESLSLHSNSPELVTQRLRDLMNSVRAAIELPAIDPKDGDPLHAGPVVIALPGVSTPHDVKVASECVHRAFGPGFKEFFIADDTWAGLVAGRQSAMGICAFAGTGASVYVGPTNRFTLGKPHKLDGWGPMIGDHGSGFRLGMSLFERIGRDLDRQVDSYLPLFESVLKAERDLIQFQSIQNWFVQIQRDKPYVWLTRIAGLARVVIEAADASSPDNLACELVKDAADAIADTIADALELARRTWPADAPDWAEPITCHGWMFRHSRLYARVVQERIQPLASSPRIELAPFHPVVGALIMAHSADWTVPAPSVTAQLLASIKELGLADRAVLDYSVTLPQSAPTSSE